MPFYLKHFLLFVPFILLFPAWVHSQIQDESPPVVFRCIEWQRVDSELFYLNDEERMNVRMRPTTRSQDYRYTGQGPLTFFLPGGEEPVAVAQTELPSGQGPYLLIFFEEGKSAGGTPKYRILAINDSDSEFPFGQYKIYNMAPYDVAMQLGTTKNRIDSRSIAEIQPDGIRANGMMDVKIAVHQENGNWRFQFVGLWPYHEETRALLFLVPDQKHGNKKIRVKSIVERRRSVESDR